MKIRNFNWLPNTNEAHSNIQYDFIELPLLHFYYKTNPGELNFNKMDFNREKLSKVNDVYMPIVHFRPVGDRDNCLKYFQGRHRTYAASGFSNAASKIVVMVPKKNIFEIVDVLNCRIAGQILNKYPDHSGIFYQLKVKKSAEVYFLED